MSPTSTLWDAMDWPQRLFHEDGRTTLSSSRLRLALKHLPGRHDQQTHGRRHRRASPATGGRSGSTERLLRAGLPEVGPWRREGRDDSDVDPDIARSRRRAAAQARREAVADLAARMSDLSDEDFLGKELTSRIADLKAGKLVLLRKPSKDALARRQDDPEREPDELNDWDYRFFAKERYEERIAADPDTFKKLGGELVEATDYRRWNRERVVSQIVNRWSWSSNDHDARALALQEAAKNHFGLRGTTEWPAQFLTPELEEEIAKVGRDRARLHEAFLTAQYRATQEQFAEAGISKVTVYRGVMKTRSGDAGGGLRPLSSFTLDRGLAEEFAAQGGQGGEVLEMTVDASQVLATPRSGMGSLTEAEIVLLGNAPTKGHQ